MCGDICNKKCAACAYIWPMKRLLCCLVALLLCGCASIPSAPALASDARTLLVLMYHSILKDPARAGKYVVSPDTLSSDIAWLLGAGYSFVSLGALVDFVDGRGELPDKPVLLTLDDGYYNNLSYVLPILIEYDCCAVIGIVGEYAQRFTDTPDPNPNYAHLSLSDIEALALSDRVEFANHSYAMHGQTGRMGSGRKSGESEADYIRAFTADTQKCQELIERCTHYAPLAYAYPYGVIDPLSRSLLSELGLRATLTCYETLNTVTRGNPASLYGLGRFNRPSGPDTESFFKALTAQISS